jgi:hypothetical protein
MFVGPELWQDVRPRPAAGVRVVRSLVLVLAAACGGVTEPPASTERAEVAAAPGPTWVRLARATSDVVLELPPSNLPPGRLAGVAPLRDPFVQEKAGKGAVRGVAVWTTRAPFTEPPGAAGTLSLSGPGGRLPRSEEVRPGTWDLKDGRIELRTTASAPAPAHRAYRLRSDALAAQEAALSFEGSGLDAKAFAFRRVTGADGTFEGVYLPAPGSVTWTVAVPPGAVFDAEIRLLPAPVEGAGSDGAGVVLEAVTEEGVTELASVEATRQGASLHASLAQIAGDAVKLRLRSHPGATRYYDFVHVVDPTIAVPQPQPRRVVVVEVSGLRRADVGTTGPLAALVSRAIAFDQAWTVAPWTLPATRALVSGVQPERFAESPTLAERLSAAGFASLALVEDPTLIGPEGADRGWIAARPVSGDAAVITASATAFFERSAGRDALLWVQLGALERAAVPAGPTAGEPWAAAPAGRMPPRATVVAQVGATIDAVLAAAGPTAWAFVLADHGLVLEGAQGRHADSLADDVVHVPFWILGPGTPAAHRDVPVSLLDVAPTVLQLVGQVPPVDAAGRSLLPLLSEPPGDTSSLLGRALVFGRARGDAAAWGVVDGGVAWRVGEPVPPGADPERRLDEALGPGVRGSADGKADAAP